MAHGPAGLDGSRVLHAVFEREVLVAMSLQPMMAVATGLGGA